MKFMTLVRSAENAGPPPAALMDAIMQLGEEATRAGAMVEMGGLYPSATGTRLRVSGGKLSVTDGPFAEAKEIIGGYAVYQVQSEAEALEWSRRFVQIHQKHWPEWEGEVELRRIFDPSDFSQG